MVSTRKRGNNGRSHASGLAVDDVGAYCGARFVTHIGGAARP
jgi:hypothetical protein